jgi:hypothetical protein
MKRELIYVIVQQVWVSAGREEESAHLLDRAVGVDVGVRPVR